MLAVWHSHLLSNRGAGQKHFSFIVCPRKLNALFKHFVASAINKFKLWLLLGIQKSSQFSHRIFACTPWCAFGYGNEMVPPHQYLKGLYLFRQTLSCSVIYYFKCYETFRNFNVQTGCMYEVQNNKELLLINYTRITNKHSWIIFSFYIMFIIAFLAWSPVTQINSSRTECNTQRLLLFMSHLQTKYD